MPPDSPSNFLPVRTPSKISRLARSFHIRTYALARQVQSNLSVRTDTSLLRTVSNVPAKLSYIFFRKKNPL